MEKITKIFERYKFLFFYLWLTLLIIWPLLRPGYILTLDTSAVPVYTINYTVSNVLIYAYALKLLSFVFPTWIIQKFLVFLVFFLAGVLMHISFPFKNESASVKTSADESAKYFAGVLYMINPFVFTRFMAGHWPLLLAYAFLPLLIKIIFSFCRNPNCKNILKTAFLLTIISILSLHYAYIGFFCFGIVLVFHLFKNVRAGLKPALTNENNHQRVFTKESFPLLKGFLKILTLYFLFNFYWLINFGASFTGFGALNIAALSTSPDPKLGVLFNVLSMYGFWGEYYPWVNTLFLPKNFLPGWPLVFILLFTLIIYGIISGFRKQIYKKCALIFSILGLLSFIFSVGVSSSIFGPINKFLHDWLPFFTGFRDSQKWSGLLILSYSVLGGIGLINFKKRLKSFSFLRNSAVVFFILIILVYTHPLFLLSKQLKPVFYPKSWFEINDIMKQEKSDFNTLFLPWHTGMSFKFNNNRLVANPAHYFFDKPIIQSDKELSNISVTSPRPESKKVEEFLLQPQKTDLILKKLLGDLNVKYVIYAKDLEPVETMDYSFLSNSKILQNVYQKEEMVLYKMVEK